MNIKTKVKGFMSFNAVLLCLVALMAGYSLLQIYGSQFSALSASRKALQAQQFAQSEADLLRNTSYDELDAAAHDRQVITGVSGWMSEVSLEAETTINEVPQRLATVKIYRNSTVTVPDFSLKVPLSSASGGGDAFPEGTILPFIGDVKDIPKKWRLCDGSNGTPDLTGRFLEGVIVEPKIFKEAGLPNITGSFDVRIANNGYNIQSGPIIYPTDSTSALQANDYGTNIGVMSFGRTSASGYSGVELNASKSSSIYKDDCTTVQPASYTVYYIMKIQK